MRILLFVICMILANHPTFAESIGKENFIKQLEPTKKGDKSVEAFRASLNEESNRDADVYRLDINNDKKMEYVVINYQGSGRYFEMSTYSENVKGGFNSINNPIANPLSMGFFQINGKTYMHIKDAISKDHQPRHADMISQLYIWENNKVQPVCPSEWVAFQHNVYTKNVKQGNYEEAYDTVDQVLAGCKSLASASDEALLKQDLALAVQKTCSGMIFAEHLKNFRALCAPYTEDCTREHCSGQICESPYETFSDILTRCDKSLPSGTRLWLKNDLARIAFLQKKTVRV